MICNNKLIRLKKKQFPDIPLYLFCCFLSSDECLATNCGEHGVCINNVDGPVCRCNGTGYTYNTELKKCVSAQRVIQVIVIFRKTQG